MIALENVTKDYHTRQGPNRVLDAINLTVGYGEKIGILGRNGAGKSTTIRILSGAELPTSGRITRNMSVSWPLAFGGAFQPSLTGLDNLKFICRVYGKDFTTAIDFVRDFSELGKYFFEPVRHYSSGMRARLAFAISMIIEFDCFLVDEVVAVGDSRFHQKCHTELFEKRNERAFVIVSHDVGYVREHCNKFYVIRNSKMWQFSDCEEAVQFYLS